MRKECMSLRDFNIDGKMMNKTFDPFRSRNYPKQIFSKTHGQLVGMHDENVFLADRLQQERNLQNEMLLD